MHDTTTPPVIGWLIQRSYLLHERQGERLADVLKARQTPVVLVEDAQDPVWPDTVPTPDLFMVLGGIRFVRDAIRRNSGSIAMQALFGDDLHAWRTYAWKLPQRELLNPHAELRPLFQLSAMNTLKHPTFIKPDHSLKIRDACVVKPAQWAEWLAECARKSIAPHALFWLSQPQVILAEYRVALSKCRGVVDVSRYASDGRPTEDDTPLAERERAALQRMVETIQAQWLFDDEMIMLDVCRTLDDFKIVECNAISTSGWYGLQSEKMVDTVEQVLRERFAELNA